MSGEAPVLPLFSQAWFPYDHLNCPDHHSCLKAFRDDLDDLDNRYFCLDRLKDKRHEVISTVSGSDKRILRMFRKQAKPRAYGKVPLEISSKLRENFSFISVCNTMEPSYSRLQLSNKHVSNINNISHNKLWLVSWFYCSWNQLCNTVSFSVFCDFWLSIRSRTGWI